MKKTYLILISFLFIHFFILSRLQFTAWPEMVSFPYFINKGLVVYSDVIHVYPPLLINTLAFLYRIFGTNVLVLKFFGWSLILSNDVLIFLILRKIIKNKDLALLGVFIYIITQPILEGNMLWPDLAITPFLLLGFLLLINKKYFFSGITFALALLTKQTGIFYLIFAGLSIFILNKKLKNIFNLGIGFLILVFPFLLSLFSQNSLMNFINWVILYPSKYWTKFPGYVQLSPSLKENIILLILFLPLAIIIFKSNKKVFSDHVFLLLFGFLICGIVSIYPRFSFFHFQTALAFLVIMYFYLLDFFKKKFLFLIFLIPIFLLLVNIKSLKVNETRFWTNEDIKLGQLIKNETPENKPIYLLGLNSNLYALADRLPNRPWLDNFGWYLEIPGVQEDVIKGFEKNPPSKIFWQTPQNGNWYDIGTYQPKMITNWIERNYTRDKEIEKGIWEWKIKK